MKNIKIRVIDIDNLEFEILEDAKKGDTFTLKKLNEFDFSKIEEKLKDFNNQKIDDIVNKRISEKEYKWKDEFINSKEYKELLEVKHNFEHKLQEKELEDKKIIDKLNNEIENLKVSKELEIKNKIIENNLYKEKEISKKEVEIEKLKNQLNSFESQKLLEFDLKNKDLELEYKNKLYELETQKNSEIIEKQNELDQLKREKDNKNIKLIGEDLENWIESEFNKTFGFNNNISIEKTDKPINGTKPDFLVKIIDNENIVIERIVIEAKSEQISGVNKKRNKDHYEKLMKDTRNFQGGYSLLVTELEKEKEFTIFKEKEFENLYVIRPYFLIHFLQIFLEITLKDNELKKKEMAFKEKEEILRTWTDFKNSLISSFEKIEKKVEEIRKESEKIISSGRKVESSINIIWDTHLQSLNNKISNFKIEKKVADKIDKIIEIK